MSNEIAELENLKVVDLKDRLKDRGLSTVGVKKQLVERLAAALTGGDEQDEPQPAAEHDQEEEKVEEDEKEVEEEKVVDEEKVEDKLEEDKKEEEKPEDDKKEEEKPKEDEKEEKPEAEQVKEEKIQVQDEEKEKGHTEDQNENHEEKKEERIDENTDLPPQDISQDSNSNGNNTTQKRALSPDTISATPKKPRTQQQGRRPQLSFYHPTNSLYVSRLARPLTQEQFKEHVEKLANEPVSFFWMDRLRTHCYISFSSVEVGSLVREALNQSTFPRGEISRNTIFADYLPEETAKKFAEEEDALEDKSKKMRVRYVKNGDEVDIQLLPLEPSFEQRRPRYDDRGGADVLWTRTLPAIKYREAR